MNNNNARVGFVMAMIYRRGRKDGLRPENDMPEGQTNSISPRNGHWSIVVGAIAGLVMLVSFQGCKKTIEIPGAVAPGPMVIDGKFDDWKGVPTRLFKDQDAVIGLCTDSSRLYIHFRTRNEQYARLIRRAGITVYVSGDGKENRDFYVRFAEGPDHRDIKRPGEANDSLRNEPNERDERFEQMQPPMVDSALRFVCYQKDVIVEKPIPTDGSQGPAAAYSVWNGFYSYELSIPLEKSEVRYYGVVPQDHKKLVVGLVWGDVEQHRDRADFRPHGDFGGFPGGGGMGGGEPGGMGGEGMRGRHPPGGSQRPEKPEKQELWIKIADVTK
jgi:hypothetical protein